MIKKEIVDETFDIDRSETYILNLLFSPNGYSFTIKDTVKDSFIALYSDVFSKELTVDDDWTASINTIISKYQVLSKKFKKIYVSFESPLFTIVPNEFFSPEKVKKLFTLVWNLPELFELHYKEVNKMVLIYAIPSSLCSSIKSKYPSAIFVGYPMPAINFSSMVASSSTDHLNLVNISNGFMINLVSQGKSMLNCTPYNYTNYDDIAYHLVNNCKHLNIVAGNETLNISGVDSEKDELVLLLSKFFKKVNLDKGFIGDHYVYSIERYKTKYWNLFNISQCE